ncbi:hypothetical protein ACF8SB_07195 [Pseudomonas sp. CJQ_8]|uniref:hypothetical protein n=1 Tax=Pseudomonas TaxID=286 RepID=UPI00370A34D0
MSIETITSLQVVEVQNHGMANQERVAIYVHQHCNLVEYCLMLSLPTPEGGVAPIKDHMLWFGPGWVNPGDWIMVYTATGMTTINPGPATASGAQYRIINLHWGKNHTIFQNRALSPMLVRLNGISCPPQALPAYQGNGTGSVYPRIN